MKRLIMVLLTLCLVFSMAACGEKENAKGDGSSKDGSEEVKVTTVTGELITVDIPTGWCLVTGTEMTGAGGVDFVCHSEEFEMGDPYIQATIATKDIDGTKETLEAEDVYGAYSGEKELANGTWYIAENAAAVLLDEKVLMVLGYSCDFGSEEVQSILGSIKWK